MIPILATIFFVLCGIACLFIALGAYVSLRNFHPLVLVLALCGMACGQEVQLPDGVVRSPEVIALGQKLFFWKGLSIDNTKSCASCHDPSQGKWVDDTSVSTGVNNLLGVRRSMTVENAVFKKDNFHDGRAVTVAGQSLQPLIARAELGNQSVQQVMNRLAANEEFNADFLNVFGRRPNQADFAAAMAAFETTIVSGEAPIDRWDAGQHWVFTAAQERGRVIFFGSGNCANCHFGKYLTDNGFHVVLGATRDRNNQFDRGRGAITNNRDDNFKFATAMLRDVAKRKPYFHAGQAIDMPAVIEILNDPPEGSELQRMNWSEGQKDDLLKFLVGDGSFPGAFESYSPPIIEAPSLPTVPQVAGQVAQNQNQGRGRRGRR
jgi:cytochrome c peroxidase